MYWFKIWFIIDSDVCVIIDEFKNIKSVLFLDGF